MPTGWQILGMKTLEGSLGVCSGSDKKNDVPKDAADSSTQPSTAASAQTRLLYSAFLRHHPEALEKGMKGLFQGERFNKDKTDLNGLKQHFESAAATLNEIGVDLGLRGRVKPFYDDVTKMLKKAQDGMENDDRGSVVAQVKGELESLLTVAMSLQAEASNATNNHLQKATPYTAKASQNAERGDDVTTSMIKNAQAKVEVTSAMLNSTQTEYNRKAEELLQTNQLLNKALLEISKLDASTASINDILEMLEKGLKLLANLKDQWSQLTLYFQEMANLVKASTRPTKMFIDHAKDARVEGLTMGDVAKDLIYSTAREAVTIGYVVNRLATGYVEVSKAHLMGPVGRLPKLMVLDKDKDKAEICMQKRAIMTECENAGKAIEKMVKKEKKAFGEAIEKRMEFDCFLFALNKNPLKFTIFVLTSNKYIFNQII